MSNSYQSLPVCIADSVIRPFVCLSCTTLISTSKSKLQLPHQILCFPSDFHVSIYGPTNLFVTQDQTQSIFTLCYPLAN